MRKSVVPAIAKAALLWVTLLAGQITGALLFFHSAHPEPPNGPFTAGQALLVVCAIDALILTLLANCMHRRGWSLGVSLGIILFGVETVLPLIEALVFGRDLQLSAGTIIRSAEASLLRDILVSVPVASLWPDRNGGWPGLAISIHGVRRWPLIIMVYLTCYFSAGSQIAWRSEAVRTFYSHIHDIGIPDLIMVQIGRGLIWCALASVLVPALKHSSWRAPLLTGLAFSGLMTAQLLYPNAAMPWAIRRVHIAELGVSNLVFGYLAALILLAGTAAPVSGNGKPAGYMRDGSDPA